MQPDGGGLWTPPPAAALPADAEHWQRIVLLPGLKLHLRDPSGPLLASIASEIAERYSAPK